MKDKDRDNIAQALSILRDMNRKNQDHILFLNNTLKQAGFIPGEAIIREHSQTSTQYEILVRLIGDITVGDAE